MRKINEAGLELEKEFESLSLVAYLCPAGVWTIGWGHTGPDVEEGMTCTEEEAEDWLEQDNLRAEKVVFNCTIVGLNENQFSALVCFVMNVGARAFRESTMLKKLNEGDYEGAADEFPRWNKAGAKVLSGLVRRRKAERELFLEEG